MYFASLLSLFDFVIIFLKQSLATPFAMMLEYVLQIQLSGEFITLIFSVVLRGAQILSTESKSEYK